MAQAKRNFSMFCLIYLVWNKIETEGCSHLSKANWTELTFIDLRSLSSIQMKTKLNLKRVLF
jgi:hypothetical protein